LKLLLLKIGPEYGQMTSPHVAYLFHYRFDSSIFMFTIKFENLKLERLKKFTRKIETQYHYGFRSYYNTPTPSKNQCWDQKNLSVIVNESASLGSR